MTIAPRLRQLALEVSRMERHATQQSQLLDSLFDLHNDLTDWAVNTEHEEAALEVMAILEKYVRKAKKGSSDLSVSLALKSESPG